MAAVTPDSAPSRVHGQEIMGDRVIVGRFRDSNTVSNLDTWTPGVGARYTIKKALWDPIGTATSQVCPTTAGGVVAFTAPAGNHNGDCYLVLTG